MRGRETLNWGAGIAYTRARGRQRGGDLFSLDYQDVNAYPKFSHQCRCPEPARGQFHRRHSLSLGNPVLRVVRLHSGDPYNIFDFSRGFGPGEGRVLLNSGRPPKSRFIVPGNIWGYRNVDMRLRKELTTRTSLGRMAITADLFNVFNFVNLGCWEGFIPALPEVNANFGRANCVSSDARRFQAGLAFDF